MFLVGSASSSTAELGKPRAPIQACSDCSASQSEAGLGFSLSSTSLDSKEAARGALGEQSKADSWQLPRGCVVLSKGHRTSHFLPLSPVLWALAEALPCLILTPSRVGEKTEVNQPRKIT